MASKNYLAILQTENEEFVALSGTAEDAKRAVFDGFNTNLKKQFEARDSRRRLFEITSEHLAKSLNGYYRRYLGGGVSIETLERKFGIHVLELKRDECYRDGSWVPRREQDY